MGWISSDPLRDFAGGKGQNTYLTVNVKVVLGAGVTAGVPVPVTVKIYMPELVPGFLLPVAVHAERLQKAAISRSAPSRARQEQRRAGIPKKTSMARTAPPPALAQPPTRGFSRAAALVVLTETVAVAVVALSVMLESEAMQEGRSMAPEGEEVSAQASVTVPE